MPYSICKIFEVESGHMLSKNDTFCSFPHGHTRRVEVVLEADDLDDAQMVCDYRAVKLVMKDYLHTFDHSMCVNTQDPNFGQLKALYGDRIIPFEDRDPTTEVIARTIYDEAERRLAEHSRNTGGKYPVRPAVRVARIRVWETSSSWAEYAGDEARANG